MRIATLTFAPSRRLGLRGLSTLWMVAVGSFGAVGCAPRHPGAAAAPETPAGATDEPATTSTRVVTEKTPNGTKTTVITTTKRTVPAPTPPIRPADPWPGDALVKYNVDRLNDYRKKAGRDPVVYDATISAFARDGSKQLSIDHKAHAHFAAQIKTAKGFGSRSAENQGDWDGVPALDPNPQTNGRKQIDLMLDLMFKEGPGGGHYENMLNPKYRRVGVGLFYADGKLYMTNDFSD